MKSVFSPFAIAALAIVGFSSFSVAAHAEGFKCRTVEGDLAVKIYHHDDPSIGTRVASTMIVSDPTVGTGHKTIALFTSQKGTLALQSEGSYLAVVDLRMVESRRKGEYVVGTRLGELSTISVDLDFSYARPVTGGAAVTGTATFTKRSGEMLERNLVCARYLKSN